MLRKREKFIKKWMLMLCVAVIVLALFVSVEAFLLTLLSVVGVVLLAHIEWYVLDCIMMQKSEFKGASKFYREVRRRLFFMGYDVNKIFKDSDEFILTLNRHLLNMTDDAHKITSIDIATAIIYSIVAVDDDEEFLFDVFLCVMDKIMSPAIYKVSIEKDIFEIERVFTSMDQADIEAYIFKVGVKEFMKSLKEAYVNEQSINSMYLWRIYNDASV